MDPDVEDLMTRLADNPPRRLGIWARTYVEAEDYRRRQGLAPTEVHVITTPAGVRGLNRPVFVRVGAWFDGRHALEIKYHLTEVAFGLDITDRPELVELVVARIISLRNAGERKEHGAR